LLTLRSLQMLVLLANRFTNGCPKTAGLLNKWLQ